MATMRKPALDRPSSPGAFVISLDFELMWGMRHVTSLQKYGQNILGARKALPRILTMLDAHQVRCTIATVGFLFFADRESLVRGSPTLKPSYVRPGLSPYLENFSDIGANEEEDPFHYAASLIAAVLRHPAHEIGCHTFSHFYCLEEGQTAEQFEADLQAAIKAASASGIHLRSFVFPMNQFNPNYAAMCRQYGVAICRGNEMNWLHTPKSAFKESFIRRGLRAADSWLNLTGHNCHPYPVDQARGAMNIPSSRFLRPWNKHLRAFENLRLARITKAMRHAARTGTVYHLWWHPHNFGANLEENMIFLGRILAFFDQLREEYGMASMTMGDIADRSKRNGR